MLNIKYHLILVIVNEAIKIYLGTLPQQYILLAAILSRTLNKYEGIKYRIVRGRALVLNRTEAIDSQPGSVNTKT